MAQKKKADRPTGIPLTKKQLAKLRRDGEALRKKMIAKGEDPNDPAQLEKYRTWCD